MDDQDSVDINIIANIAISITTHTIIKMSF